MTVVGSTTSDISKDLFEHCNAALSATIAIKTNADALNGLAKSVSRLELFVRNYTCIEDPSVDTTDEIINWVFSEAPADLCSAIWLLASGFYKSSASSLRNALDIATAALYFQIRENTDNRLGGFNQFFTEWEGGAETPNWREMKKFLKAQPAIIRFQSNTGFDLVEETHKHFKFLCAYSHSAARVTAINTTGICPAFEDVYFARGCELTSKTISHIAMLWQIAFPQILATEPFGPPIMSEYEDLFLPPFGPLVFKHK